MHLFQETPGKSPKTEPKESVSALEAESGENPRRVRRLREGPRISVETQTAGILAAKRKNQENFPAKTKSLEPDLTLLSPGDRDLDLSGNFTRVGSGRKLPNLPAEKLAKPNQNTQFHSNETNNLVANQTVQPNQTIQPQSSKPNPTSKPNQISHKPKQTIEKESGKSKPAALRFWESLEVGNRGKGVEEDEDRVAGEGGETAIGKTSIIYK